MKREPTLKAKPKDRAYIAGYFDGEGCIYIRKLVPGNFQLACGVCSTNKSILALLQMYFGGGVGKKRADKRSPNWKPLWRWQIVANQAYSFLKSIHPYLKIKRVEAELGIQFQEAMPSSGTRLTEESLALREAQYILMRSLKKGGQ